MQLGQARYSRWSLTESKAVSYYITHRHEWGFSLIYWEPLDGDIQNVHFRLL